MLSSESAIGLYGHKALSVLKMASNRIELWNRAENQQPFLNLRQLGVSLPDRIAEQICNSAAEIGITNKTFKHCFLSLFIATHQSSVIEFQSSLVVKLHFDNSVLCLQPTTLLWMPSLSTQSMDIWHHSYHETAPTRPYSRSQTIKVPVRL